MRKIALNLDTLAVESFETTAAARDAEGTVLGHMAAAPSNGGSDCQRTPCCPYTYAPTCTCAV